MESRENKNDKSEQKEFVLKPYLPILGNYHEIDATVLSYLTASNLEFTLKSIPSSKSQYTKTDVIRAKYGIALKNAYDDRPTPEQLETIKQGLTDYANSEAKEDPEVEEFIQKDAITYAAFQPENASQLIADLSTKKTKNASHLIDCLIEAGASCKYINLTEKLIHDLSTDELARLINADIKYNIEDKNSKYLFKTWAVCFCCGPYRAPYVWSSMLVACFENDVRKTTLLVDKYPNYVPMTASTLNNFFDRLELETNYPQWANDWGCSPPVCCLTVLLTCGMYAPSHFTHTDAKAPINRLTNEGYKFIDIAKAKWNLMSAAPTWQRNSKDKNHIHYYLEEQINATTSTDQCLKLYQTLLNEKIDKISNHVESSTSILARSIFCRKRYLPLKIWAIESLQQKILSLLEIEKDNALPKDLLNIYKNILQQPLFNEIHISKGVNIKSTNEIKNRMAEIERFFQEPESQPLFFSVKK